MWTNTEIFADLFILIIDLIEGSFSFTAQKTADLVTFTEEILNVVICAVFSCSDVGNYHVLQIV